ncbi:MAG: M48 family metalloprotease [Thermodesulfobacteriota bacterium]
MFQNLIPVILVLLAYEVLSPDSATTSPDATFLAVTLSLGLFIALSAMRFRVLGRKMERAAGHRTVYERLYTDSPRAYGPQLAAAYDRVSGSQTVAAMALCASLLYFTDLKAQLQAAEIVQSLPTLGSLVFVSLFLAHMEISWIFAYPAYRALHPEAGSRRDFLRGNISLSVPALLPWFAISLMLDALRLLPWPAFNAFIESTAGELSFFLAFLLAVAVFGPVLIARFWGCKPLPAGYPRDLMEDLCRRAGVRCSDFLTWPLFGGGLLTAGVMGLVGRYRYVLVTPGLLRAAGPEEISAVLAHEIGHVRGRHLWLYLLLLAVFGVFSYGAATVLELCASGLVILASHWATLPVSLFRQPGQVFFSVVMIGGFLLYFRFFFGYFMRQCERDADLFVFTGLARPEALAGVLARIAFLTGRDPEEPNWHHFGIGERIRFIERAMADPSLVRRHKTKLKQAVAAFLCFLAVLGATGTFFDATAKGREIRTDLSERVLAAGVASHPDDALLAGSLATLYLSRNQCEKSAALFRQAISVMKPGPDAYPQLKSAGLPAGSLLYGLLAGALTCTGDEAGAVAAYEASLRYFPDNAESANNLAWTLATSKDPAVRNPEKALFWAERAARLLPEPFVLDTLAESLFINGRYEEAIAVEKEALAKASRDKDLYRKQIARFTAALSGT